MSTLQRSRSLRKPASTTTTTANANANAPDGSPSRLPVKPLTRSATTSSNARTLRNGTTTGLSRATSGRQPAKPVTSEPAKRETRYPPSTTTTRPRPAVRPTSADGPTQTARKAPAPTHTRAKSTATVLRNAPVLRPPSSGSSASSTTTTTTTTRPTRSSTTSASEKLPGAAPRLRPAFSTLQQHYSPAKSSAPKPLTSTFLAPPSPSKLPANVAASAETSRLQTELLQLHILHRDAPTVDATWRASAQRKLGERFSELASASKQIDDQEKAEVEKGNILAIRNWAVGGGLEERIQILDAAIAGLWALEEPGGRYARVVRRFERWVDRMCEIEESRSAGGALIQENDVLFIGELDSAWKDECAGLVRRLDTIKRQLDQLGDFARDDQEGETKDQSSLHRMVEGSRELVQGMLTELAVMDDIERDALAREDEWIDKMNRDDGMEDTPRAGAVWRAV
ncbi:AGA1 A-agglutinin anchor subunit [Fusarium mexicanum]|uniref:AGA1 A-agglutinin anchor subunit n=1 Tax=Fusarium mexicanum TaxID=751941 RepID=A0A8H5I3B2_9HYPO|nr:AGA1 A-agglutinin anchor subunit [Fusarium mexicanum]